MKIFNAFTSDQCSEVLDCLSDGDWVDGRKSAVGTAAAKKNNWQIPHTSATFQKVRPLLLRAMINPTVLGYTFMRELIDPRLAKYGEGNAYGWHVDAALLANKRTDLSFTIFLNDPSEYEGGELTVNRDGHLTEVKGQRGQMIIYPSGLLHKVSPVKSGIRYVIVGWINSNIKLEEHRQRLFAFKGTYSRLIDQNVNAAELEVLNHTYHSLVRDYSD